MNEVRLGLERRLQRNLRRVSSQHRQLDEMYGHLLRALDERVTTRAQDALRHFEEGLSAHFSLEEKHTFPAVHGAHPRCESELIALAQEHRVFLGEVERLAGLLGKDDWLACDQLLDELALRLARHEGREERLLEDNESEAKESEPR